MPRMNGKLKKSEVKFRTSDNLLTPVLVLFLFNLLHRNLTNTFAIEKKIEGTCLQ